MSGKIQRGGPSPTPEDKGTQRQQSGELQGRKVSLWTKVPGLQKFVNFITRVFGRSSEKADVPTMSRREANVVGKSSPNVRKGAKAVQKAVSKEKLTKDQAIKKLDTLAHELVETGNLKSFNYNLGSEEKLEIVFQGVTLAQAKLDSKSSTEEIKRANKWSSDFLLISDKF